MKKLKLLLFLVAVAFSTATAVYFLLLKKKPAPNNDNTWKCNVECPDGYYVLPGDCRCVPIVTPPQAQAPKSIAPYARGITCAVRCPPGYRLKEFCDCVPIVTPPR